jgi:hypothetical protein
LCSLKEEAEAQQEAEDRVTWGLDPLQDKDIAEELYSKMGGWKGGGGGTGDEEFIRPTMLATVWHCVASNSRMGGVGRYRGEGRGGGRWQTECSKMGG